MSDDLASLYPTSQEEWIAQYNALTKLHSLEMAELEQALGRACVEVARIRALEKYGKSEEFRILNAMTTWSI